MPATGNVYGFTKINGFKRLIKCRVCGKSFHSKKDDIFCEKCSTKGKG